jgi:predicted NUDIX family NTP pyrophosphohydrolase
MAKRSAGILMYRRGAAVIELLLVHPGDPFWTSKDHGAWSIPKGEHDAEEEPLACAIREFAEELGSAPQAVDACAFLELGELVQPSRKVITAFAVEGDFDPAKLKPNPFEMEWPLKIGRKQSFPEVDRGTKREKRFNLGNPPSSIACLRHSATSSGRVIDHSQWILAGGATASLPFPLAIASRYHSEQKFVGTIIQAWAQRPSL